MSEVNEEMQKKQGQEESVEPTPEVAPEAAPEAIAEAAPASAAAEEAATPSTEPVAAAAELDESGEGAPAESEETPAAAGPAEETDDAAQLEAALTVVKEGDLVTGRVVRVNPDYVLVDVGYKSEGVINKNELTHRSVESCEQVVKVGDELQVVVLSVDAHGEGGLRLSKRRADERAAWSRVEEWHQSGQILEAQVTEAVKGGLVVDLGLRAFLPASQVERGYVSDLSKYVGQVIRVKIIELDARKSRVILSRKKVLEEERDLAKGAFWTSVEEGQIRAGVVKSITDFGAFIDLGGVDGLLHVSEMSYGRVKHPGEVFKEGDEVRVRVIRLDREKGKVSLSLKQTLPDPWTGVADRYPEGSIIEGRVARLATFGAFVELEPGVDGLIHISQLADYRVNKPDEVVQPGETVRVKVTAVRPEDRRISLSLRDAPQAPRVDDEAGVEAESETEEAAAAEPAAAPEATAEAAPEPAAEPEAVAEAAAEPAAEPEAAAEAAAEPATEPEAAAEETEEEK